MDFLTAAQGWQILLPFAHVMDASRCCRPGSPHGAGEMPPITDGGRYRAIPDHLGGNAERNQRPAFREITICLR